MSRLPPVPHDQWDDDAFAAMARGQKLPPSNALGLLAHHPDLAKAFLGFNLHLLGASTLPKRIRELAVLRVAWRRRCQYEWAQHLLIAKRAGVTDEEIDQIRAGADTPINRAVAELETDSTLSDATYQLLSADLSDRQLMDLVFTVGAYGLLAMAFNTFEVELDPGFSVENFTYTDGE